MNTEPTLELSYLKELRNYKFDIDMLYLDTGKDKLLAVAGKDWTWGDTINSDIHFGENAIWYKTRRFNKIVDHSWAGKLARMMKTDLLLEYGSKLNYLDTLKKYKEYYVIIEDPEQQELFQNFYSYKTSDLKKFMALLNGVSVDNFSLLNTESSGRIGHFIWAIHIGKVTKWHII